MENNGKAKLKKTPFMLKDKAFKIWIIVSPILLVFFVALTIISSQVAFCYNGLNALFGGERMVLKSGDPSKHMRFVPDYANKDETFAAAQALNERICEEGIILLKNEDETLPLKPANKISVFGKSSVNPVFGGSGSSNGGGSASLTGLYSALTAAGFEYNPVMKSFYEGGQSGSGRPSIPSIGSILTGYPIAETPLSSYTPAVKNSYARYPDAALVFISRIGGEGYDLPRTMFWNGRNYTAWSEKQVIPGARSVNDHYLQLDQNETDMIREACGSFDSVILIINCSSPMELGFLDDTAHYAYNTKLKAALWIGNPGGNGLTALGRILSGEANPSGRTVDTYARDFKNDPAWNNFGNNLKTDGNRCTLDGKAQKAYFVEYREGIYAGYRYYETRGFTEGGSWYKDWYKDNVVFPFGYGKSYTTFDQEIISQDPAPDTALTADGAVNVTVRVTNTGKAAGKEVVQLYYTAPYTGGEIEKAHVVLGAFVKTDTIEPDGHKDVTLKLQVRDMASYDYNDANGNGFKGWELDAGLYMVKLMRNAHEQIDSIRYSMPDNIQYPLDDATGTVIENLFDDVSGHIKQYLSRSDWEGTWPAKVSEEDLAVDETFLSSLNYSINDKKSDPWYSAVMPDQSPRTLSYKKTAVKLYDLSNKDYDDPLWKELLNQLTVAQMAELISAGHFRTIQIKNIGKPLTTDADGPLGFVAFVNDPTIYNIGYYAGGCVLGSTWNAGLAEEFGIMIGNEGLAGNEKGDGRPYSGWYAPAMNIHRSQFGGRNFEYYSEDGLLSGVIAQAVVKGAKSKGVYTYCKHFALNEQETDRDSNGLITWASEQAMRELYFLPFEMCVKNGGTTAIMSSFNRIGTVWTGGHYNLLTRLLRGEWGFKGMVITDFNMKQYMNGNQMIRAGGDLSLSPSKPLSSVSSETDVTAIRRAAKNILYTVAKSNAMNGMGEGVIWSYALPYWLIGFIAADATLFILCAGWGALVFLKAKKRGAVKNCSAP